jgi:chromosome partitioning protein
VLIPIQCEYYALEGISQLLNTVRLVQQNFNPGLAIDGVLLHDVRLAPEISAGKWRKTRRNTSAPRSFGRRSRGTCELAEAPSFGKPILL